MRGGANMQTIQVKLLRGLMGSGKCVKGDTLIQTEKGLMYIDELPFDTEGFSEFNIKLNSSDGCVQTSHLYKDNSRNLYEITTDIGLTIKVTGEHPLLVFTGSSFIFKKASDLCTQDVLCVERSNYLFSQDKLKINFEFIPNKKDFCSKPFNYLPEMNTSYAAVLGYLVANGSKSITNFIFSSHSNVLKKDFKNHCDALGILCTVSSKKANISGVQFVKLLEFLYGGAWDIARNKHIPKYVRLGNRDNQIIFIRSLFDCDGYFDGKNNFEYSTASEKLSYELQIMLLNFGIISHRVPKFNKNYNHTYWSLFIYGENIKKYATIFGSLKYDFTFILNKNVFNTNIDVIYGLYDYIQSRISDVRKSLGVRKNGQYVCNNIVKRFLINTWKLRLKSKNLKYNLTYPALKLFLNNCKRDIYPDFDDVIDLCDMVYKKNFFYTKISCLSVSVFGGSVYDVCIPSNHQFIANGFVNHNSTWAKEFVKNNQHWKRLSRDDVRHMLSSYSFDKTNEELVTKVMYSLMDETIKEGYNIVLDETNLNPKTLEKNKEQMRKSATKYSKEIIFEIVDFNIDLKEAIIRDKYRDFSVGEDVIKRAWKKYILPNKQKEVKDKILAHNKRFIEEETLNEKKSAIIVDIDGTLAINDGSRSYYDYDENVKKDKLNFPIGDIVEAMRSTYYHVIIVSGREGNEKCRKATLEWLEENGVSYHDLFMRREGDSRSDVIVKTEIYEEHIKDKYNVLFVADDRKRVVQNWINLGLFVLDVSQDPYAEVDF